jgi:hypothetical protein
MARKPKANYLVTTRCSLGWGGTDQSTLSHFTSTSSEEAAVQQFADAVDEMRSGGAMTPTRAVTLRRWPSGTSLAEAPVLREASYYDPEQNLSAAQTYAARVHDWHHSADRMNINLIKNRSVYGVGYSDWNEQWGPEPETCPHCGDPLPLPMEPYWATYGPPIDRGSCRS